MTLPAQTFAPRQPSLRGPARALTVSLVVMTLAAASGAQAAGDPLAGQLLFNDTRGATSNVAPFNCIQCHFAANGLDAVSDPRRLAFGNPTAPIAEATAKALILNAIATERDMQVFSGKLNNAQIDNLAAYVADTPKLIDATGAVPSQVEFNAKAANADTVQKVFRIKHSVATNLTLALNNNGATVGLNTGFQVVVGNNDCSTHGIATPLTAGAECNITVAFKAPDEARHNTRLTVTMTEAGNAVTRFLDLTGGVEGKTAPPPLNTGGGAAGDDGGGGAMGWAWLAALAAAAGAAVAARRKTA